MSQRATLLEGSLGDIELANVVQTVSVSRRSVALELRDPDGAVFGTLVLKAGQVVSATSEGLSGLEALRKLVAVRRPGRFLVYRASGVDLREHLGPVDDLLSNALTSAEPSARGGFGVLMQGSLDKLELRVVLEALSLSRRCVTLELLASDDTRLGVLCLKGGQVLSASRGQATGEAAARALLETRGEARFVVSRSAAAEGAPLLPIRALLRPPAREDGLLEVGDEDLAEAEAEEMRVTQVAARPTPSQAPPPPPLRSRPPPLPSQPPPRKGAAASAPPPRRDVAGPGPASVRPAPPSLAPRPSLPVALDPVWPIANPAAQAHAPGVLETREIPGARTEPRAPAPWPDAVQAPAGEQPQLGAREIPGARTEPRAPAPRPDAAQAPADEQPHLLVQPKVPRAAQRSAPPPSKVEPAAPRSVPVEAPRTAAARAPAQVAQAEAPEASAHPGLADDEAQRPPAAGGSGGRVAPHDSRPNALGSMRAAAAWPQRVNGDALAPHAPSHPPSQAAQPATPSIVRDGSSPRPAAEASAARAQSEPPPAAPTADATRALAPSDAAPAAHPPSEPPPAQSDAVPAARPPSQPPPAASAIAAARAPAARPASEPPPAARARRSEGPAAMPARAAAREASSDASITARHPAARGGTPIVAVTSPKGGAGRSTLALNLAVSLARRGRRVVMVDADASNLLPALDLGDRAYKGIADALEGWAPLSDTVLDTRVPGLKLIPSGDLSEETYRHPGWQALLTTLAQQADLVLVDCAPGWYGATPSVLEAATHQLLVLQAEPAARRVCTAYQARLQRLLKAKAKPELLGVVINMLDYQVHASVRSLEELSSSEYARHLFDIPIPRSPVFMEASARGVPIVHVDQGASSTIAWVFETLATALLERLQLERPVLASAPLLA